MQYLSSFAFVHRALSAHSVLVNSHLVCKVARLGHSPQVRAQPRGLCILHLVQQDEPETGGDLRWPVIVLEGLELTCTSSSTGARGTLQELRNRGHWGWQETPKT